MKNLFFCDSSIYYGYPLKIIFYYIIVNMKYIFIVAFILLLGAGCENTGYIKTSDCRENIEISSSSIKTYFRSFTCEKAYGVTNCCRVQTTGETCDISYCYEK
jgi:hypothetical protein